MYYKYCDRCNGTGEGRNPDSACTHCDGSGSVLTDIVLGEDEDETTWDDEDTKLISYIY